MNAFTPIDSVSPLYVQVLPSAASHTSSELTSPTWFARVATPIGPDVFPFAAYERCTSVILTPLLPLQLLVVTHRSTW